MCTTPRSWGSSGGVGKSEEPEKGMNRIREFPVTGNETRYTKQESVDEILSWKCIYRSTDIQRKEDNPYCRKPGLRTRSFVEIRNVVGDTENKRYEEPRLS